MTQNQKRIFHSIQTGKNLFLSNDITDEEIIWNIGVMGIHYNNQSQQQQQQQMMVVIPNIQSLDDNSSPMVFTKEWYEHSH